MFLYIYFHFIKENYGLYGIMDSYYSALPGCSIPAMEKKKCIKRKIPMMIMF